MFLMLYWIGLLDTLFGVILVLVAFELPFAIFIMNDRIDPAQALKICGRAVATGVGPIARARLPS
jgi:hypothetical protein